MSSIQLLGHKWDDFSTGSNGGRCSLRGVSGTRNGTKNWTPKNDINAGNVEVYRQKIPSIHQTCNRSTRTMQDVFAKPSLRKNSIMKYNVFLSRFRVSKWHPKILEWHPNFWKPRYVLLFIEVKRFEESMLSRTWPMQQTDDTFLWHRSWKRKL